jgi:signal transduction histidine kinase
MKQYDDAIGIYNRIMPLVEEIGSDSYLSSASNNLGDLYSQKGDYERALPYFKKALSLKVKLGQKMGTINTLANIGQLYTEQSRFDSASQYYNRALIMALQVGNKWAIQGLYSGLGDLYHKEGRYEQALLNYRFSLEGAQATQQLANIAKLKKSMAETFAAMGRHDSAFVYLQQYVGLQDTLFNEDMQRQIADMNAKYADKQREAEFQQLKSEKALQQFQLIFAILTSLFFVISSVALWIRFRDKKAANTLLSEQRDEIAQQNHLLRQSVSDLRQFAYVASHDLREPLRTIRSYLQLLKKRYSPHIEQSGQDFIEFAVEGAQRMDRLLRDLLLYSRIGRENQPLVEVDLNEVLEFVAGNLGQQIEENRATLLIEENLPVVEARETRMVQLFQNLVSNAIKFRREEPPVIRVSGRVQNGFAIISVRDNGIGIDPRFEEKIFTIFQRLHTQEAYEGTGIGLAICKRIAEQQGGEIWFESQLNEGTTFFVKLPLRIQGAFLDEHPSPQQIEEKA